MAKNPSTMNPNTGASSCFASEGEEDLSNLLGGIVLSPSDAVRELKKREGDLALRKQVEEYLENDIPDYFKNGPILYLARYLASPCFETMRFIHLAEPLGMKIVISQDTKDTFFSFNKEKKALCKLPICKKVSKNINGTCEQFENVSIVDFNTAQGKPLNTIQTLWGENLVDFHNQIFKKLTRGMAENPDDAVWIDSHHRGDPLEHYKKLLALFLVHGIFFEDYVNEDEYFIETVLLPAFQFVEDRFGCRPLIAKLSAGDSESYTFWRSYPKEVLDIVNDKLHEER